ncbi:MAG: MmpS family transport accessory protein, partial [Mycobacterium sp.]
MTTILKRLWIPLVIVVVVVVATFTVMRVRTFFGTGPGYISTENSASDDSEPFDPKVVKYEVWGE